MIPCVSYQNVQKTLSSLYNEPTTSHRALCKERERDNVALKLKNVSPIFEILQISYENIPLHMWMNYFGA